MTLIFMADCASWHVVVQPHVVIANVWLRLRRLVTLCFGRRVQIYLLTYIIYVSRKEYFVSIMAGHMPPKLTQHFCFLHTHTTKRICEFDVCLWPVRRPTSIHRLRLLKLRAKCVVFQGHVRAPWLVCTLCLLH